MKVTNLSSFHSTSALMPVLDFMCKRAPTSAEIMLKDQAWGLFSGGYATKEPAPAATIWMSRALIYPCVSQHVPEVAPVTVHSFEEELVLVLAHEIRHLSQFNDIPRHFTTADAHAAEIDAEWFASKTLKAWKRFAIG